jgi:hypothetical protein
MRHLLPGGPVFEAVPDPTPDRGAFPDPSQPDPEPEPEAFTISQEDWEQQRQESQFIMSQLQQLAQMAQPNDPNAIQLPEDSLLTEQDLMVVGEMIRQATAPFAETRDQWNQSEGEQRASDVIADDVARNGEFLLEGSLQKARDLSENYYAEAAQRYGPGPQAAEAAIQQACADVREWESQVGEAYYERKMNEFRTLGGAPVFPPAASTSPVQQHTSGGLGGERGVVKKYFG